MICLGKINTVKASVIHSLLEKIFEKKDLSSISPAINCTNSWWYSGAWKFTSSWGDILRENRLIWKWVLPPSCFVRMYLKSLWESWEIWFIFNLTRNKFYPPSFSYVCTWKDLLEKRCIFNLWWSNEWLNEVFFFTNFHTLVLYHRSLYNSKQTYLHSYM